MNWPFIIINLYSFIAYVTLLSLTTTANAKTLRVFFEGRSKFYALFVIAMIGLLWPATWAALGYSWLRDRP